MNRNNSLLAAELLIQMGRPDLAVEIYGALSWAYRRELEDRSPL